jgi:hypoxanthine phosphoribosyltransferase
MEFVRRQNPESTAPDVFFNIPRSLATLLEDTLYCKTAKKKKDGLRWECNGTGVLVLDDIKNYGCTIYILPTGVKKWKTPEIMKKIM